MGIGIRLFPMSLVASLGIVLCVVLLWPDGCESAWLGSRFCSVLVCFLYLDVLVGGFRWGLTLGVWKAMWMRGGPCATELCLMVDWVYVIVSS